MRMFFEREIRDAYLDSLDEDRDAYEALLALKGDYHDGYDDEASS